jgi:peptide/nickel transport system substrate-binding protein
MNTIGRRSLLVAMLVAPVARALGRIPYGGGLRVDLPLSFEGLDPHAIDDLTSALVGPAVFDSLFAWDTSGRPYPVLAAGMPEAMSKGSRVALRPGLITARGRPLDGADVVWSIERARKLGARPLLSGFGTIRRVRDDRLAVDVESVNPDQLAEALSSPVAAIVPKTFSAAKPDGTGAFRADASAGGVSLVRNELAARGPSFLDRIDVRRAADLAAGLRTFESGEADIGFLGAGLHRRRSGAVDFRTQPAGWVVLRTGPEAGEWGAPGVASRLVQALDPARLAHLGVAPPASAKIAGQGWGGASASLYVDEGSSYLVEIARAVAAALSQPGRELRPTPVSRQDFARLREGGRYATMIDFVRRLGPSPRHSVLSLLGAANSRLAEKPPRLAREDIAVAERTLSLAVLGEVGIAGARAPDVHGLEQWDLGSVWRGA